MSITSSLKDPQCRHHGLQGEVPAPHTGLRGPAGSSPAHFTSAHGAAFISRHTPSLSLARGCSLCLEWFLPDTIVSDSLSSYGCLLQCHLLGEAFPEHLIQGKPFFPIPILFLCVTHFSLSEVVLGSCCVFIAHKGYLEFGRHNPDKVS